jgi:hypothetical protein
VPQIHAFGCAVVSETDDAPRVALAAATAPFVAVFAPSKLTISMSPW